MADEDNSVQTEEALTPRGTERVLEVGTPGADRKAKKNGDSDVESLSDSGEEIHTLQEAIPALSVNQKDVIKSGNVERKTKVGFRRVWVPAYMELKKKGSNALLRIYKSEKHASTDNPIAEVTLNKKSIVHARVSKYGEERPMCFNIRADEDDYLFRTSLKEKNEWVTMIRESASL
eukprot:TRINITY_DN3524_c0_g1_i1.p1 TRINITY_DN3524_c0_g1~~TRINITY_DN3524_c0_g1_i1.p1  ORF type:complete len:176 (+),score=37.90 TRINITY_DN3524_c0_g1_i1:109-636(+)